MDVKGARVGQVNALTVYDLYGREVFRLRMQQGPRGYRSFIHLPAPGVYLYVVTYAESTGKRHASYGKFVSR